MTVPPVALSQDNLPEDVVCSICMTLPSDPVITPCHHIFCRGCILQALRTTGEHCPIDRVPCRSDQIQPLQGAIARVWGSIQVKCGCHDNGCAWRGSLGDYAAHNSSCSVGGNGGTSSAAAQAQAEIDSLKQEIASLQYAAQEEVNSLKQEVERLQSRNRLLESRPDLPTLFDGTYNFRRENVVQLSQLISRHLENKPYEINQNRIYNCVRACYTDLEKGYSDNPEFYYHDMRMLLATCLASNWFSDNQLSSIKDWWSQQFTN